MDYEGENLRCVDIESNGKRYTLTYSNGGIAGWIALKLYRWIFKDAKPHVDGFGRNCLIQEDRNP